MSSEIIYIFISICAISGLWLLWQWGYRKLMLDNFRDSFFALRQRLYLVTAEGRVSCESDGYRALELFINGMIRYAHRFTFLTFLMSFMESQRAKKEKDYLSFSSDLVSKIMQVDDALARTEMLGVLADVRKIVYPYLAKTSLFFMVMAAYLWLMRSFRPIEADHKQGQTVFLFEREAYLAAKREAHLAAKGDKRLVNA